MEEACATWEVTDAAAAAAAAADAEPDTARCCCCEYLGWRADADDARKGADAETGDEADVENRDTGVADETGGSELSSSADDDEREAAAAEEPPMDSPPRRRRFSGAETPAGRTTWCKRGSEEASWKEKTRRENAMLRWESARRSVKAAPRTDVRSACDRRDPACHMLLCDWRCQ